MEFIRAQNDTLIISNGIISRTYLISQIDSITFSIPPVSAGNEKTDNSAPVFIVRNSYPNPFNPETSIKFSIPARELVTLKIYSVLGKEVATLVNEIRNAGTHEVKFNASSLPSGTYFYRIESGNFVGTKKMMLVK